MKLFWSLVICALFCSNLLPAQCTNPPVLNPATLPTGTLGVSYSTTIQVNGGSGTSPFTFSVVTGSLPGGLTLNAATGEISGFPGATGIFPFEIQVTDKVSCTATQDFIIIINSPTCPTITLSPLSLPPGPLGVSYSQMLTPLGGVAPYTFAISGGALPNGLGLNTSTGVISGMPATTGSFTFTITVTDKNGCSADQVYGIIINLADCDFTIALFPSTLPNGIINTAYPTTTISANPSATYTFAVLTGNLPPGLTLDPMTGDITGTPTAAGTFNFTISATGTFLGIATCAGTLGYQIVVCPADIPLTPATLPTALLGFPYFQTITPTVGTPPFIFGFSGNLPAGMTHSATATSAIISGTPTNLGTFGFTITTTDANNCTGSQNFSITVQRPSVPHFLCKAPKFLTCLLPDGALGDFYVHTIRVSGQNQPVRFTIVAGDLPPGLFLDSLTGRISGVPTAEGTFDFEVQAKSRCGRSSTESLSITVGNA